MNLVESAKFDRSVVVVEGLHDPSNERAFWLMKTSTDRLAALELMRQLCEARGYVELTIPQAGILRREMQIELRYST